MEWLWIVQLMINISIVLVLVFRSRPRTAVTEEGVAVAESALIQIETNAELLEREVAAYRKKTEDQLRFLVHLCEQAHRILTKHSIEANTTASLEEEELKALRNRALPSAAQRAIPSVAELEARKAALRAEIPMDLRSLLRDQLT